MNRATDQRNGLVDLVVAFAGRLDDGWLDGRLRFGCQRPNKLSFLAQRCSAYVEPECPAGDLPEE
jgi:hypothetical protein